MDVDWKARAEAAEKTVDVLRRRALMGYAGDAASAIHRELERARRRQQANELRTQELERARAVLEREVLERTSALRTILDNVAAGFLLVSRDGRVQEGFTRSCYALLGAPSIAGALLPDLLGIRSRERTTWLLLAIEQVFEDLLPEDLSLEQMPDTYAIGRRMIRLQGVAVRNDAGAVVGLLVTLTDITAQDRAERDARENRRLLRMVKQRSMFCSFVEDCASLLDAAAETIWDQAFVRRAVHTVKGNAACYELDEVVAVVHDVEGARVIDGAAIERISAALKEFIAEHQDIIGVEYQRRGGLTYTIDEGRLAQLRRLAGGQVPNANEVARWAAETALLRADLLIGPVASFVDRLAERLGKLVRFQVAGGDVLVDAARFQPVAQTLVQILRNAVDHGIERPDERGCKSEFGMVEVVFAETPEAWTMSVEDDGRGIDVDALVVRALAAERVTMLDVLRMDDRERMRLVFLDSLSTASGLTDISGRGMGLSAVAAAAQAAGGTVEISSVPGAGTRFTTRVPKPRELCAA